MVTQLQHLDLYFSQVYGTSSGHTLVVSQAFLHETDERPSLSLWWKSQLSLPFDEINSEFIFGMQVLIQGNDFKIDWALFSKSICEELDFKPNSWSNSSFSSFFVLTYKVSALWKNFFWGG